MGWFYLDDDDEDCPPIAWPEVERRIHGINQEVDRQGQELKQLAGDLLALRMTARRLETMMIQWKDWARDFQILMSERDGSYRSEIDELKALTFKTRAWVGKLRDTNDARFERFEKLLEKLVSTGRYVE